MKKKLGLMGLLVIAFLGSTNAQVLELIRFVSDKVVKAIDLKIQEMQNSVLVLQNLQRQAENNLSRQKLAEIGYWEEQQKELSRNYYASLVQVKPDLIRLRLVTQIREQQQQLVALYQMALTEIKPDPHLGEKEKQDFVSGGAAIQEESYTVMRKVNEVLKAGNITATDAERMQLIRQSAVRMDWLFNRLQVMLTRIRADINRRTKEALERDKLRKSFGL